MPRFDAEVFAATAAVDEEFAEGVVLRPYAAPDPRSPATPDVTRDVVCLCGVWIDHPADPHEPNAYDSREYKRPGIVSGEPRLEISASQTACFTDFAVKRGDMVDRTSNQSRYEVRSVFVTPNGTIKLTLNRVGPL